MLPIGSRNRRLLNPSTYSRVANSTALKLRHGPRRWTTARPVSNVRSARSILSVGIVKNIALAIVHFAQVLIELDNDLLTVRQLLENSRFEYVPVAVEPDTIDRLQTAKCLLGICRSST